MIPSNEYDGLHPPYESGLTDVRRAKKTMTRFGKKPPIVLPRLNPPKTFGFGQRNAGDSGSY